MQWIAARAARLFTALGGARKGATSVEYAFIITMIFLAIIVSVRGVGNASSQLWSNVSSRVGSVGP